MSVLQCSRHPTEGIPSAFVINSFSFESKPRWVGSPPVQISKVKQPSLVPFLLEASNLFGESIFGAYDAIFFEPYHSVRSPEQVTQRISWNRHGARGSNVLCFDGHVELAGSDRFPLESFDDGVRNRY